MHGISDVELGLNAPYAASEISLPTPAKLGVLRAELRRGDVEADALGERPGRVPSGLQDVGRVSLCSVTGESAAAATSTTLCAAA